MKTLAQLEAEQAKAREALLAQHATAKRFTDAGIPLPDGFSNSVHGALHCYYSSPRGEDKARSLGDALAIFDQYPVIVPFNVLRAGSTIMHPEKCLREKEKAQGYKRDDLRNSSDYALQLRVWHLTGDTYQTNADLEFFAMLGDTLLHVSIKFGQDYIGMCHALRPSVKTVRGANNGNRIIEQTFTPNNVVQSLADSVMSYASGDMGPIKKSADHRFMFASDHGPDNCTPAECTHARAQLVNLADILKV